MVNETSLRAGVGLLSTAVFAFLLWLLYARPGSDVASAPGALLPAVNAAFNAACVGFLVAGARAIRGGDRRRHVACMLAALVCSALFLAGYVTHHALHGDTPFPGHGIARVLYLAILASHVLVTAVTLPMILLTLARAAGGDFVRHRAIARRTLPLWLYVSATGVAIFVMLRAWS